VLLRRVAVSDESLKTFEVSRRQINGNSRAHVTASHALREIGVPKRTLLSEIIHLLVLQVRNYDTSFALSIVAYP